MVEDFKKINDKNKLKKLFRQYSKLYHPDTGGIAEEFIKLKNNYEQRLNELENNYDFSDYTNDFNEDITVDYSFNNYSVQCTLADMLNKNKPFKVNNMEFLFPGFWSPFVCYNYKEKLVEVSFNCIDMSVNGFKLVPNMHGVAATLSPYEYNSKIINYNGDVINDQPMFEDDVCLIFENVGIPIMQPITNKLLNSLLIVNK